MKACHWILTHSADSMRAFPEIIEFNSNLALQLHLKSVSDKWV
jgi:hypothetical protein